MNLIKQIVYKIFGNNIGKQVRRVVNYYKSGREKINCSIKYKTFSCGYHTSCGYYDLDPIREGELLVISSDNSVEKAKIHKINIETCEDRIVGESFVVNWQQGNRLKWIGNNRLIFNSFEKGEYVSVEMCDSVRKIHPWPIYDVNRDTAVTLDFNRLGWLRPGYGYTKFPLREITLNDCAIRFFKLSTNINITSISYRDIIEKIPREVCLQKCYVNHLSFSPSGRKCLFFFIEIVNGIHQCSLGVWDGERVLFLDTDLSASHYTWKDDNTILTTSYDKERKCRYYLYSLEDMKRQEVLPDILKQDGHPTYIKDDIIVTDTYPDQAGFQKIRVVDISSKKVQDVLSIYSTAKHVGVERCDLHPRYAKETQEIYFDADIDGKRRVLGFKLEDVLS